MLFLHNKKQKLHPFQTTVLLRIARFSNTVFCFANFVVELTLKKYFTVKE